MWCCGAGDDEGRRDNSGDDLRAEMLKFGSKSDVTVVHRATIRLLDDAEIIHCDFQVKYSWLVSHATSYWWRFYTRFFYPFFFLWPVTIGQRNKPRLYLPVSLKTQLFLEIFLFSYVHTYNLFIRNVHFGRF